MNLPAYLAVARVARRQATRAPWRSALVIAMVALPIAALTATAIGIRTAVPTDAERMREQFGAADLFVDTDGKATTGELAAALPAGSRIASFGSLSVPRPLVEDTSIVYLSVYEYGLPIDRSPVKGIYRVLDGRAPTSPGEAAVHPHVLDLLGLHLGDVFSPRRGVDLRVVGTCVSAGHLNDLVVVVGPGTLASVGRDRVEGWFVDLPAGAAASAATARISALGLGFTLPSVQVAGHGNGREQQATLGAFAAAAVLLLGTGLIAGAALAMGARRQLRTLGLLGAGGAERRQVRATVLFGGATLGVAGSVVGIVVGIAVAYALHPYLDRLAARYVGPIDIPYVALTGALALGTLAATLAALGPARTASRVAVQEALADRTPPPRRPDRIAAAGLVVAAGGSLLVAQGTATRNDPVLSAGLVVMIVGVLVGIPLLVTWVGRVAGALPSLPRIAARDVARHGRRTGAALAAGAIAVALPVAIGAITLSDQLRYERTPSLSADQLSLSGFGPGKPAARQIETALKDLRAAFPGSVVGDLVPAVATVVRHGREREVPVSVIASQRDGYLEAPTLIGDGALLRALHAQTGLAALERGEVVGVGPDSVKGSTVDLGFFRGSRQTMIATNVPAEAAGDGHVGFGWNQYVISPQRASELGLRASSMPVVNAVFRAGRPLTSAEMARAKDIVSAEPDVGVASEADPSGGADLLRGVATLAGTVVALLIVGVIIALLSAESRRDRVILVAIGAGPRSRRSLAGASAALVGLLSAVFGVAVGLAPTMVFLRGQGGAHPLVVPWTVIGVVVLVVPAIAGLAAAAVSRQPKAAQLLRPIS
jgi:putative ABC transport system permease protein